MGLELRVWGLGFRLSLRPYIKTSLRVGWFGVEGSGVSGL